MQLRYAIGITCTLLLVIVGKDVLPKVREAYKIQDTKKAVEYFETEMRFTTNPHGVNLAISSNRSNATIVDVRHRKAYEAGHIPGAINIPVDEYNFDGDATNFPGLRKDGFNYVYCYALLCDLSQRAAKKFASLGYPVKEMKGGFQSWVDHGYPVEKGK